jgi:hypothetical protein
MRILHVSSSVLQWLLTPLSQEKPMNTLRPLTATVILTVLLLAGCRVSEHKNGDNDNVDIGTPFGSMQVKTNNSGDTTAIGLAAYPGAVPVKDDGDKDGSSANVNMSFGSFHLGVKAASFQTPDSQDKVLAFYRKDLAQRYGDVIECRGNSAVGTPARTSQGLTCDDQKHTRIGSYNFDPHVRVHHGVSDATDFDHDNLELRAGSAQHQHIVGLEDRNGGTKIGLVALDLPSHLSDHDDKDSE